MQLTEDLAGRQGIQSAQLNMIGYQWDHSQFCYVTKARELTNNRSVSVFDLRTKIKS